MSICTLEGRVARVLLIAVCVFFNSQAQGTEPPPLEGRVTGAQPSRRPYLLSANDLVLVKVYRHDDLEGKLRIANDGTSTFPLLGTIQLGGKTLEEASAYIRELLSKDYLVNPQVTVTVLEYAKRRFSVLGQVDKPGAYEIPSEESVNLLEAIAMAGGFTRLANTSKITVTRVINDKKTTIVLDAKALSKQAEFLVLPDDTISIPQRIL